MNETRTDNPTDFGKWFSAMLEEHKFVSVRKKELEKLIARAEAVLPPGHMVVTQRGYTDLIDRHDRMTRLISRLVDGFDPSDEMPADMAVRLTDFSGRKNRVMIGELKEALK